MRIPGRSDIARSGDSAAISSIIRSSSAASVSECKAKVFSIRRIRCAGIRPSFDKIICAIAPSCISAARLIQSRATLTMRRLILKWYRGLTKLGRPARRRRTKGRSRVKSDIELGEADSKLLFPIWVRLQESYFADRIDLLSYEVRWSTWQQKRTLASCNVSRRRVVVAPQLRQAEMIEWLEPVLYHEMCHAAIGHDIERRGGKRLVHGPQFNELVARHPKTVALTEWLQNGGWTKHNLHLYLR